MLKPFFIFVGLRYTLARKHNLLLSFVALISMLGVCLGVMILIVALSIMNGSISTLRDEALKSVPHVTLSGQSISNDLQSQIELANAAEGVIAAAPFIEGEASMRYQGQDRFIRLRGVAPGLESGVVNNPGRRYRELLDVLAATDNGIILGAPLAGSIGFSGRGEVSVITLGSLLARSMSDSRSFQVVGFADFGFYDRNNIALINLPQAEQLFAEDNGVELQLRLKVDDVFAAEAIAAAAFEGSSDLRILPWNKAQATLFNALSMEKVLTSFMLLMIVLVGAVNIVSTLVMVVSDKAADIAILRTMGASRKTIMSIFVVQGLVAGFFGTLLGAVLGILLAFNITDISLLLERLINSVFTDSNFYLISHLQTELKASDVSMVCAAALLISLLATLYPAYRASKIQPAEVLRYE